MPGCASEIVRNMLKPVAQRSLSVRLHCQQIQKIRAIGMPMRLLSLMDSLMLGQHPTSQGCYERSCNAPAKT